MCIRDSIYLTFSPSQAYEPVSGANLRFHLVLSITIPSAIGSSIAGIRCLLNESSTVSLHLFRGLPLGLTPSGLHLHLLLATLSLPASSPGVPTILVWLRLLYSSWVSHPRSPSLSRFSLCLSSSFQSPSSTQSSPLSQFYSPFSLSCSMSLPHTTVLVSTLPRILLSSPLCSYIYLSLIHI